MRDVIVALVVGLVGASCYLLGYYEGARKAVAAVEKFSDQVRQTIREELRK